MKNITLANGSIYNVESGLLTKTLPKIPKLKGGFIVYEGASVLDGAPIVAIATTETKNEKTGNMIQLWIIRSDISPVEAIQKKLDSSICGLCPHRHNLGGACYVLPFQAPSRVYESYKKGNYKNIDEEAIYSFKYRKVRLGAYGDVAAIPANILKTFVNYFDGFTGYTHQANHPKFDNAISDFCMISCETENEAKRQQKLGRKTFRVKTDLMKKLDNEVDCLSESHGLSCLDCGLCNGKSVNIVINVHGNKAKRFKKFERIL